MKVILWTEIVVAIITWIIWFVMALKSKRSRKVILTMGIISAILLIIALFAFTAIKVI